MADRKFGILLSQAQQIFKRQWDESLPKDWLAKLPDEITLDDDGLQPLTLKLTPVDQGLVLPTPEEEEEAPVSPEGAPVDEGLVLPTPEEEEEGGPISPKLELTDRLLLLL